MTQAKICGLTRPEDAELAGRIGASFVGVIFAESRRRVDVGRARTVLEPARGLARAVGVFGPSDPHAIVETARAAFLDVVQLHGDPTVADIEAVRDGFAGEVWAVHRVRDAHVPDAAHALAGTADAIVLDAWSDRALGGTGHVLDWHVLAPQLVALRGGRASLVLAGGLRAGNVAQAIAEVAPDVVDVSSGVESAPGIKSAEAMREFMEAVHAATRPRSRIG